MVKGRDTNHEGTAENVISKLKDDGDFDTLRLKIIRKVKDNEKLRSSIISMVKQSAALNRPGAENMKPRQLSDAIYQEVGDQVKIQISDSLWEIIRSPDGMKNEIIETVQSVYNKLLNPKGNEVGESSSPSGVVPLLNEAGNSDIIMVSTAEVVGTCSDSEPDEPPGFSLSNDHLNGNRDMQPKEELLLSIPHDGRLIEEPKEKPNISHDVLVPEASVIGLPPGFSAIMESIQPCDGGNDDPDVPPGFG